MVIALTIIVSPIVAGLLWVLSITISVISFNWIFVAAASLIIGLIISAKLSD